MHIMNVRHSISRKQSKKVKVLGVGVLGVKGFGGGWRGVQISKKGEGKGEEGRKRKNGARKKKRRTSRIPQEMVKARSKLETKIKNPIKY